MAVAMTWSQSKVARWEAGEPVRLTEEDRIRLARLRVLADRRAEDPVPSKRLVPAEAVS